MTSLAARAETLKGESVINFLDSTVYPAEAKCLHHGIDITYGSFRRRFPAVDPDPHFFAGAVVILGGLAAIVAQKGKRG